ncbi:MAG: cytidylate kinase-like family protein [Oscillospiraceae bacterium]|nr:cytidylate kinase-like family protein [Oscillospiraceae bacterium]
MNRVITISRQFGSGGRTIGKEVAARLGIPCYDSELILKIAEKSGLSKEYIESYGEHTPSSSWWGNILADRDYNGHSIRDDLWRVQHDIITELAEKESCVIVGRCADYILKDTADCLTVFIHASLEKRAERIVRLYGESDEKPEKRLLDKDKRRKSYYQFYTDSEWGNAANYHIALDSGELGIGRCVSIIADLYEK